MKLDSKMLDQFHERFLYQEKLSCVYEEFLNDLTVKRNSLSKEDWKKYIDSCCLIHPIADLLHEDPLAYRAFSKPRGYPGDAKLLDFIYRDPSIKSEVEASSSIGQSLYNCTSMSPASVAVRLRKNFIAEVIDTTASQKNTCHIFSVACGHLRELVLSEAIQENRFTRFVGLDHDPLTISYVSDNLKRANITCHQGNIMDIIRHRIDIGKFDLIYASGLYDYLPQRTARRLTKTLFDSLNSGGRLLVLNALNGIIDAGYMEAFMDWVLVYRDCDDLLDLIADIPVQATSAIEVNKFANQTFGYLIVTKQ